MTLTPYSMAGNIWALSYDPGWLLFPGPPYSSLHSFLPSLRSVGLSSGVWWGHMAMQATCLIFGFLYFTECPRPSLSRALVPGAAMNMPQSLGTQPLSLEPPSLGTPVEGSGAVAPSEHCWPVRPTLRNELDTFSVHFYIFFGPSVALPPERPAVFALRLLPVLDSGGVLSLELQLNAVCPRRGGFPVGESEGESRWRVGPLSPPGSRSRLLLCFPPVLHTVLVNKWSGNSLPCDCCTNQASVWPGLEAGLLLEADLSGGSLV